MRWRPGRPGSRKSAHHERHRTRGGVRCLVCFVGPQACGMLPVELAASSGIHDPSFASRGGSDILPSTMPERVPLEDDSGRRMRPFHRKRFWFAFPAFVLLLLVIASIFWPEQGSPEAARQLKCMWNLRQLGISISFYAGENGHAFPDSLPSLLAMRGVSPKWLICPGSHDSEASGTGPAGRAAALLKPGHCSYIYVGGNLTDACNPDCVVAFEDPAHHRMQGAAVLHADGHVSFEPLRHVVRLVAELEAGRNPPTIAWLSDAEAKALYDETWKPKLPSMRNDTWGASLPRPTTQPAAGE